MMKSTLSIGFLGVALVTLCGCGPELDQVTPGAKEDTWEKNIRDSYVGYRHPRTAPPATVDNMSPRLVEAERAATVPEAGSTDVTVEEVVAPAPVDDVAPAADPTAPVAEVKDDAAAATPAKTAAPASESATPAKTDAVTWHEVKAGETLGAIAKQYYGDATKYDLIIRANNIKDARKIQIGTKLAIPQL